MLFDGQMTCVVLIDDYESERGRVLFDGWMTCIDDCESERGTMLFDGWMTCID